MLKHLSTQPDDPTNQNPPKSPKLLSQRIRKYFHKTFGTSVMNSPLSPLSLVKHETSYHFQRLSYNTVYPGLEPATIMTRVDALTTNY